MKPPPLNSLIRFRSNGHEATVTAHTKRGFKYLLAHEYPYIPRWGMSFSGEGEVFLDVWGSKAFWEQEIERIEEFSEWLPASETFQQVSYTK